MNVTKVGTQESRIHLGSDGFCQSDRAKRKGYSGVFRNKRIMKTTSPIQVVKDKIYWSKF